MGVDYGEWNTETKKTMELMNVESLVRSCILVVRIFIVNNIVRIECPV